MDEPYRMTLPEIASLTDWQVSRLIVDYQRRKADEIERIQSGTPKPSAATRPQTEEEEVALLEAMRSMLGG